MVLASHKLHYFRFFKATEKQLLFIDNKDQTSNAHFLKMYKNSTSYFRKLNNASSCYFIINNPSAFLCFIMNLGPLNKRMHVVDGSRPNDVNRVTAISAIWFGCFWKIDEERK